MNFLCFPKKSAFPEKFGSLGFFVLLLNLLLLAALPVAGVPSESIKPDKIQEALELLLNSIEQTKKELKSQRKVQTKTPEVETQIQSLEARLSGLQNDFNVLATGVNRSNWGELPVEDTSPGEELNQVVKPFVNALKLAIARPRAIEAQRSRQQFLTDRLNEAKKAIQKLKERQKVASSKSIQKELSALLASWEERLERTEAERQSATLQLEELQAEAGGLLRSSGATITTFLRTRGVNILMAIVGAFVAFFVIYFLHCFTRRIIPRSKKSAHVFSRRAIELSFLFLRVFAPLLMVALILYFRSDWVLLIMLALLFVAFLWAIKDRLPNFFQQLELLLNLGPVREGERIIIDHVPWEVIALDLDTTLYNPLLQGGTIRLEAEELVDHRSRPYHPKEPWFPTSTGDWILLSDGLFGKILLQTPEQVKILRLGGSHKTYRTVEFLSLAPENLSHNFRVTETFGIDYSHQEIAIQQVPDLMQPHLMTRLGQLIGKEKIKNISVEFFKASPSSLDYRILADFTGEAASHYRGLSRAIQAACVDLCNQEGWVIPLPQLTLHKALATTVSSDGGATTAP